MPLILYYGLVSFLKNDFCYISPTSVYISSNFGTNYRLSMFLFFEARRIGGFLKDEFWDGIISALGPLYFAFLFFR